MIAKVFCACGRNYLQVAGIIVAMEGDPCRDEFMSTVDELRDEADPVQKIILESRSRPGPTAWDGFALHIAALVINTQAQIS